MKNSINQFSLPSYRKNWNGDVFKMAETMTFKNNSEMKKFISENIGRKIEITTQFFENKQQTLQTSQSGSIKKLCATHFFVDIDGEVLKVVFPLRCNVTFLESVFIYHYIGKDITIKY